MRWTWALGMALLILAVACERADRRPARAVSAAEAADLVLHNGYIYTVDGDRRIARAMAVRDGKIIFVGDDSGAEAHTGPDTRVEDLQGRLVLPGFVAAQMHVRGLGNTVNLYGGNSIGDYLEAVARFMRAHPERQVVVGEGWDSEVFADQPPHKGMLDQVSDTVPIVLFSRDYGIIWANSEALAAAGINNDTADPPGGVIEKDDTGLAIGVLRGESAVALVAKIIPEKSEEDYRAEIRAAQEAASRWGITTLHDAGIKPGSEKNKLAVYQKMADQGQLDVRVRASFEVGPGVSTRDIGELKSLSQQFQHDDFKVYSVKLFADGTVEGATALLKQPYAHRRDYRGERLLSQEQLNLIAQLVNARDMQVQAHASGDAAVRMVLDAFAHSRDINGRADRRNGIAGLQLVDEADMDLFAQTNTIALVQPSRFAGEPKYRYRALPYLGEARTESEFPMKRFFARGITVASGTGYPLEKTNGPLAGIQIGITRRALDAAPGDPSRGLNAEEGVTLAQMVESFTINGAVANRLEAETGSLERGKWADFIVLDKNLFQIPVEDIHRAQVLRTYYKGRLVFERTGGEKTAAN